MRVACARRRAVSPHRAAAPRRGAVETDS